MSYGVPCPRCGVAEGASSDTRQSKGGVRRRRTCSNCGCRFTTRETLDGSDNGRERLLERRLRTVVRAAHGQYDDTED